MTQTKIKPLTRTDFQLRVHTTHLMCFGQISPCRMETPQAIFTHTVLEPAGDRRILGKKAPRFNWENRRKHKFYCH